jgi:hypothetical protein
MSKRGRKEEKPFGMKWKSVRVTPTVTFNGEITNAMETELKSRDKFYSLSEFIEAEKPAQMRVFQVMGCDTELAKRAWEAIELAYESAGKIKENE